MNPLEDSISRYNIRQIRLKAGPLDDTFTVVLSYHNIRTMDIHEVVVSNKSLKAAYTEAVSLYTSEVDVLEKVRDERIKERDTELMHNNQGFRESPTIRKSFFPSGVFSGLRDNIQTLDQAHSRAADELAQIRAQRNNFPQPEDTHFIRVGREHEAPVDSARLTFEDFGRIMQQTTPSTFQNHEVEYGTITTMPEDPVPVNPVRTNRVLINNYSYPDYDWDRIRRRQQLEMEMSRRVNVNEEGEGNTW